MLLVFHLPLQYDNKEPISNFASFLSLELHLWNCLFNIKMEIYLVLAVVFFIQSVPQNEAPYLVCNHDIYTNLKARPERL